MEQIVEADINYNGNGKTFIKGVNVIGIYVKPKNWFDGSTVLRVEYRGYTDSYPFKYVVRLRTRDYQVGGGFG